MVPYQCPRGGSLRYGGGAAATDQRRNQPAEENTVFTPGASAFFNPNRQLGSSFISHPTAEPITTKATKVSATYLPPAATTTSSFGISGTNESSALLSLSITPLLLKLSHPLCI
ncbi:hypothetical protein FRB95_010788 [Tulasnella sp. JGI-2019a]|nr:hypothetical protein FRB95_010788 [Tulasnella sp. JGI-2019a]